jgi:hypothetical protein
MLIDVPECIAVTASPLLVVPPPSGTGCPTLMSSNTALSGVLHNTVPVLNSELVSLIVSMALGLDRVALGPVGTSVSVKLRTCTGADASAVGRLIGIIIGFPLV